MLDGAGLGNKDTQPDIEIADKDNAKPARLRVKLRLGKVICFIAAAPRVLSQSLQEIVQGLFRLGQQYGPM